MDGLITAGELAKLACTTKRTVLFYDEKGVLKPERIDANGYRYYSQRQILEYQMILLLTTLGVPLKDIKSYLDNRGKLQGLFEEKRPTIIKELRNMKVNLKNVDTFLKNLKKNHTMIEPEVHNFKPVDVKYIEVVSSYSKIGEYCVALRNMINKPSKDFTAMAIFEDQGYRPKECHIKIACFAEKDLTVKKGCENKIKQMRFSPGKVISYKHYGPGEMLSLFWKELEKYCQLNKIKVRANVSDFEIYWKVNLDPNLQMFEIFLPIE